MTASRPLRWYDTITVNAYYIGLTTLSQTMTPLVVPLLVQQFVGEQRQGSAYGTIRLWSLMMALLMQALMGMLSDRSALPWGRRRPFIFVGTLANLALILAIGATTAMQGNTGYWTLFALMLLLMVACNTGHGAVQGLIPDLVPEYRRGVFSSIKAILEVPLPIILTSLTIGRLISGGYFWTALFVLGLILLLAMLATMFVPEQRLQGPLPPLDLAPFIRLFMMTAAFTLVILGMGLAIRALSGVLAGLAASSALLWMGLAGLAAMTIAIGAGVYLSANLALGRQVARQNPAFIWWVVGRLAFLVGSTNIPSFAIYFIQGRLGMDRSQAAGAVANLFIALGGLILLSAPLSGWLADRLGRRPVIAISGLVAAAGGLVLALASNLTAVYIGGALVGAAAGAFYTANWALGTELAPGQEAGRYLGISNLAGAGAGAVGAYIGGPIADHFTNYLPGMPGAGYALVFGIYAVLFIFSIFTLFKIKTGAAASSRSPAGQPIQAQASH